MIFYFRLKKIHICLCDYGEKCTNHQDYNNFLVIEQSYQFNPLYYFLINNFFLFFQVLFFRFLQFCFQLNLYILSTFPHPPPLTSPGGPRGRRVAAQRLPRHGLQRRAVCRHRQGLRLQRAPQGEVLCLRIGYVAAYQSDSNIYQVLTPFFFLCC